MIRYYEGVEGSGKTCMMTKDLYRHKMYGGRVLALPGYELYGRSKKSVLSELIYPEQIMEMIQTDDTAKVRDQKIAIAGDEITNFFNNHSWQSKINDILETLFAERRKLGIAFLMTGPEEERLPANVRFLIHEMVHCLNAHSLHRVIPNDMITYYYKEDRRGMLSHPKYKFTKRKKFYMKRWHRHYNTYAAVGYNQNLQVVIPKRKVVFDSQGLPVEVNEEDSYNFKEYDDRILVAQKVEELRSLGYESLTPGELASVIEELGMPNNKRTKQMFYSRGIYYDARSQSFVFRETDTRAGVLSTA